MANRFWVGGTGTWDAADTTHWAATSGGAGGVSVPGSSDAVNFDGSSGGGIVTTNTNPVISSLVTGSFTGTLDFSANNNTLTTGSFTSNGTAVRTINRGSGTWYLTGFNTGIWSTSTATNLTLTGTGDIVCNYTGSTGTRFFSIGLIPSFPGRILITGGLDTFTLGMSTGGSFLNDIDFTGFVGSLGGGGGTSLDLKGNLTFGPGMSSADIDTTHGWQFTGSGTQTITSNGVTFNHGIFVGTGSVSAHVVFADDLTLGSGHTLSVTQGIMDKGTVDVTAGLFAASNTNTRSIISTGGNFYLTGVGTVWNLATTTNLTFSMTNTDIKVMNTTNSAITFAGGSKTYRDLWFDRGSSTATNTITGTNTFRLIRDDGGTDSHGLTFPAGVVTTYDDWQVSGALGKILTLRSSTTTNAILTKTSSTISNSYNMDIDYITANPDNVFWVGSPTTYYNDGGHNIRVYFNYITPTPPGPGGNADAGTGIPKYTVEIYSLNPVTQVFTRIDIIETFTQLQFFTRLDGIGGCIFNLAIQDPKATAANLTRYKNQIAIKREGTVVFFGPITKVSGRYQNVKGDLSIEANTYLQHLRARFSDVLTQYTGVQQCTIAWNLINLVQSRTNGGLGITQGASPTSTTRDRTYEYSEIGQAIIDLSGVINGFDFSFDPTVDSYGMVTGVVFNCYYPYTGMLRNDLPKLTIGTNVHSIDFRTDGELQNSGIGLGSGTGEVITSTLDFGISQQAYTRRELIDSQKSVSVPSTLSAILSAHLTDSSAESFLCDLTIKQDTPPSFGDYSLGDTLVLDLQKGEYLNVVGYGRVIELNVQVDNQGAETVTPKLSIYQ